MGRVKDMRLPTAVAIILAIQGILAGAGGYCLCEAHTDAPVADLCCSQEPMGESCCCQITDAPEVPSDRAIVPPTVGTQLHAAVTFTYEFLLPVTDGSARPDDIEPAVPQLLLQSTRIERGPPA